MSTTKKAYIAGGCFWGMEDLFRTRPGVIDTEVGYQGGQNDNPTYKNHPGHAEGIEIIYDTNKTSFREILDFFFRMHIQRQLINKEMIWGLVIVLQFSIKTRKKRPSPKK